MESIKTILHPTDFSDPARSSFQFACALASDLKARLIVFHVVPPRGAVPPMSAWVDELIDYTGPDIDHAGPDHELKAWTRLRELQQTAQEGHGLDIDVDLSEGDPAMEILKTARHRNCDLIVMGSHGKTGLRHLLMGTVAERVLRKAPCPVLTVQSPLPPKLSPQALFAHQDQSLLRSF